MRKFYNRQALKRRLIVIAMISLLLASILELYTFGLPSDFFTRWLRTFFVIFTLTTITALGIVPGVHWLVNKIAKF